MDRSRPAAHGAGRAAGLTLAIWVLLAAVWAAVPALAQANDLSAFAEGRQIMMVRHAYAPGTGDPADFRIGDCSTQRNLNEEGREQARRLGAFIRAQGIERARVLTSQWCRCKETAELLGLGEVEEFTGLNSFYTVRQKRDEWLAETRALVDGLGMQSDDPVILVTHAVTISAIARTGASSGEAVLLTLNGTGEPDFAGRLMVR